MDPGAGLFGPERAVPVDAALAPDARVARVAVERAFDAARDPGEGLSYLVPEGMEVAPGARVRVPLGRDRAEGLVVEVGGPELAQGVPAGRLRAIAEVVGAALPPDLVGLAQWMARYYICPLGTVAATMLPAAVKHGTGARTRTVLERAGPDDLATILASAALTPEVRDAWARLAPPATLPEAPTAKELARHIGARTVRPINRLVALGLLVERRVTRVASREPAWRGFEAHESAPPALTDEQSAVVQAVGGTLGRFAPHLLLGVTGSGKTEVYLALIRALARRDAGASALVLVPEIALTPQTTARFEARLGDLGVAVLHSGLPAAERHRQWKRAAEGRVRVVVGTRSAVFAPLDRLGLIVVDEEHDHSYKQDQAPRYNARDVAVKRAHDAGCPVLLGSATPSLESWANATEPAPGRVPYALHRLTRRATGAALPEVSIVDLAEERKARRREAPDARDDLNDAIGPTLERAIGQTLEAGGQVLLLLNRRGYAAFLACSDRGCGYVHHCDHCDAAMVLHRARTLPRGQLVRCHHCAAEQVVPRACPACGKGLVRMGVGTQRLEEELEARFAQRFGLEPGRSLRRVDADAMTHARHYHQTLRDLAEGTIRLLMGTQMIAKGLDFPNVRLVGVVSADTALALPDFRAAERTFQLVAQVAGRSGRGGHAGRVIVQTMEPHAAPIVRAARHDYEGFARAEMEVRRLSGLPPIARLCRIVCRDPRPERAESAAQRLAEHFRGLGDGALQVQGPAPCVIARVADQHRVEVLLSAPTAGALQRALAGARAAGLLLADAHTAVDVDPVSLL